MDMFLQRTLASGALTKLNIKDAAAWATSYLKRDVSESNISYLLQYAKVNKYLIGGKAFVDKNELKDYYDKSILKKENLWKDKLGSDLDWSLSFDNLREFETTKHVHRLHPYKGKFIPQLVEYFLDSHINSHKKKVFFKQGDIVLDPFMGSGTTLVQAKELGLHSIGADVSKFNCTIAKSKVEDYDFNELRRDLNRAFLATQKFSKSSFSEEHDNMLKERLFEFNQKSFPNPEYKHALRRGGIIENEYAEKKFLFSWQKTKNCWVNYLKTKFLIWGRVSSQNGIRPV